MIIFSHAWCLRCLLLVMCTYPFVKKPLTLYLARGEGRECYFGCNLMQRKVLASSHQHLMAEAPHDGSLPQTCHDGVRRVLTPILRSRADELVLPPSSVATRLRAVVQVRKRAGCAPQ